MKEEVISKKGTIFIFMGLGLLLIACVVGGSIAYFISQTDTVSNTFRKGSLVVETTTDLKNESYNIRANESIIVNPKIKNKGSVDAYVFLVVEIPYEIIRTTTDDEIGQGYGSFFAVNSLSSDWIEINSTKDETSKKYTVVYAYKKNNGVLEQNGTTSVAFQSIKFESVMEGCFAGDYTLCDENLLNKGFSVKVTGLGVQARNLTLTGSNLKDKLTNVYNDNFGS